MIENSRHNRVMILASIMITALIGVAALLIGAGQLRAEEHQPQRISNGARPLAATDGLYPLIRRNLPITLNQPITLRILDNADTIPGNLGWLTWDGQNNTAALCDSLTAPGNSQIYYNPGIPPSWIADYSDHIIAVGKWVQGAPGNKNVTCVTDLLDWHIANQTEMVIPQYADVVISGTHANYRVAGFAAFRLLSYNLGTLPELTIEFVWVTAGDYAQTITMTKSVAPTIARAETPVTYTLSITSQSPAAVNSLVMSDVLPAELTFISGTLQADTGSAVYSGGVVSWTGVLSPGQHAGITFAALVNAGTPPNVPISNTATLRGDGARNGLSASAVFTTCQPVTDAGFAWVPITPTVGGEVAFTGTATGTQPIDFAWALGDNATGAGMALTHTYAASGTYTVVMTATNACGQQVVTHTITVKPIVPPCEPVEITAMASNEPVQLGQAMHLTATVTSEEPITYTWNFGGAGEGIGLDTATPVFTYTAVGTYTVWLTAENACPSTDTSAITVHVNPAALIEHYIYLPLVMR